MRKGQRRKQTGSLFHNDSSWYVRCFEDVWDASTKTVVRRRVAKKLPVPFAPPYDTSASVQRYVEEILFPLNAGTANPRSTRTVREFTETEYFPRLLAGEARQITIKSYRATWQRYISPCLADIALRDFSTKNGEDLLRAIGKHHSLSSASWAKIKALLSAIFSLAIRLDTFNPGAGNPMRYAKPPKADNSRRRLDAYGHQPYYTVQEIKTLLTILPEPAKTIVLTAVHTGLRKSEIRGLKWTDLSPDGRSLSIARSVAPHGEINAPKTPGSRAPIPVSRPLAAALAAHRKLARNEWIFPGPRSGEPINIDNLTNLTIRPALKGTTVVWKGWHAFRRATATWLHHLKVDDRTTQGVLRHSDIKLTQNIYEASLGEDQRAAVDQLAALVAPEPDDPNRRN